jgi:hypothetical protein
MERAERSAPPWIRSHATKAAIRESRAPLPLLGPVFVQRPGQGLIPLADRFTTSTGMRSPSYSISAESSTFRELSVGRPRLAPMLLKFVRANRVARPQALLRNNRFIAKVASHLPTNLHRSARPSR